MSSFREAINNCELMDIGYSGDKYTWRRGKKGRNQIKERLDRFLINYPMSIMAPNIKVNHLNFLSSDHRPIMAHWEDSERNLRGVKVQKLLRFEEG